MSNRGGPAQEPKATISTCAQHQIALLSLGSISHRDNDIPRISREFCGGQNSPRVAQNRGPFFTVSMHLLCDSALKEITSWPLWCPSPLVYSIGWHKVACFSQTKTQHSDSLAGNATPLSQLIIVQLINPHSLFPIVNNSVMMTRTLKHF